MENTEERLTVRQSNVHLIHAPKEKRENGAETIFEELMAEATKTDFKAQQSSRINKKISIPVEDRSRTITTSC